VKVLKKIFFRFSLFFITTFYCLIIWIQSGYFNPESIHSIWTSIPPLVILFIGFGLELLHFIEFGILYFLMIVLALTFGPLNVKKETIAIAISVSYAVIDEIHQYYVPFRSFSLGDIIKDFIGIIVIWYFVRKSTSKGQLLNKISSGLNN
jgi:polysaccharide biosynthesis protein VpsQ